jgi:hypothetical protein
MKRNISFLLLVSGSKTTFGGSFYVKGGKVAETAYEQVRNIKRETGYRPMEIVRVMVDDQEDITEEVIKIDEAPLY